MLFRVFIVVSAASSLLCCAAAPVHPSAQPSISEVDLRYTIYLLRLDIHTTISPHGKLRSVIIEGKSQGPKGNVGPSLVTVHEGQLSQKQISELVRLFVGWEKLNDSYGGVADGPEINLRYGDKLVGGGSELPAQVLEAQKRINEIARSLPTVGSTKTRVK